MHALLLLLLLLLLQEMDMILPGLGGGAVCIQAAYLLCCVIPVKGQRMRRSEVGGLVPLPKKNQKTKSKKSMTYKGRQTRC